MNKGTIDKNYTGEYVVVYEYRDEYSKRYEEYPVHPQFKYYDGFVVGQQVSFIQAKECSRHYPEYCDCITNKMYALVVLDKKKKSWIKRLLSKFKRR